MIPAHLEGRRILIRASILPGKGKETPWSLSKEFLKSLGVKLNIDDDSVEFQLIGERVTIGVIDRGRYATPMFEFHKVVCPP